MKKYYVLLFTLIFGLSQIKLNAQCNLSANLSAIPDSVGSYSYTITAAAQNASPFATSYLTISPGPTFYGQNTVNYTFPFGGTFVICYTITDSSNTPTGSCSYTVCDTVVVGAINSCGSYIQVNNNGTGSFTFTGTPNTPNGWSVSYSWSFGDGSSSGLNPATHTYMGNGTYTVCLFTTATDTMNPLNTCSGSSCQVVTIQGGPSGGGIACYVGFNSYNLGNGNFSFVNTSYSSDSSALTFYNWTFDGVQFSTLANPNYVVTDTLPHYVCLGQLFYNPITGDSCYSSFCDTIQPAGSNNGGGGNPSMCQAGFVLWQDSLNPSLYYGVNTSTGSSSMSFSWDFGDGTTATGPYPTHTYATTGAYNVCLTVVDSANNCTSTYCDSAGVFKIMNPGMSQIIILPNITTGILTHSSDFSVLISPNPVNENSTIKINSSQNRKIELEIFDVSGRKLNEQEIFVIVGNNNFKLNTQDFGQGIYSIRLTESGKVFQVIRIIK